jgi:hypothetical protein
MEKTLKELIVDAIEEARILECGRGEYDEDNMLFTAMRLSGAPFSFVKEIYEDLFFFT